MALNANLYNQLCRLFVSVKIAKEGQSMNWYMKRLDGVERPVIREGEKGEEYHVCCPFCNDERFRLWINHRWNTTDRLTGAKFGLGLCNCFNPGCDLHEDAPLSVRRQKHTDLSSMLKPYLKHMQLPIAHTGKAQEARPVRMPDELTPLNQLPADHPAIVYLAGRGFSPYELAARWKLSYCTYDPHPCVHQRLVIPVYFREKLVGYQTRYIENNGVPPSDNIPKYFTAPGMPKSKILYNFDHAKNSNFGLIMEGVTDVWRLPEQAVCSFGSTMSHTQITLSQEAWQSTGIGLMFDDDVAEKSAKSYKRLLASLSAPGAFTWPVLQVQLPPKVDPGDLQPEELRAYLQWYAQTVNYGHNIIEAA